MRALSVADSSSNADPLDRGGDAEPDAATVLAGAVSASAADDDMPSEEDVATAEADADAAARDVAAVRADLAVANERLRSSAVSAVHGRGGLQRCPVGSRRGARRGCERQRRRVARPRGRRAEPAGVRRLAAWTATSTTPSSRASPPWSRPTGSRRSSTPRPRCRRPSALLDGKYDAFEAASTLAGVADQQAEDALARAEELEADAAAARDEAAAAEERAGAEAESIARTKTDLIEELAELQGISYALAEKRQSALEQKAAEAAAMAAQKAAEEAAAQAAAEAAAQAAAEQAAQQAAADKAAQEAAEAAKHGRGDAETADPDADPDSRRRRPPRRRPRHRLPHRR